MANARTAVGSGGWDGSGASSSSVYPRPAEIKHAQASRIAATPCPPAAQMEMSPRTGLPVSAFFCQQFRQGRDDPAARGGERVARGQ